MDIAHSIRLAETEEALDPFLRQLNALPFVRKAKQLSLEPDSRLLRFDARIRIETKTGARDYYVEVKRSYLDAAITRAILALAKELARQKKKLLLLARYIPRPTAQELIDGGVDFVDLAGNIHVSLKPHYHWTVVGNRESIDRERQPLGTAATLQVLLAVAAHPESAAWTVRELAAAAGVSKSKAASARRDLVREGTIREVQGQFHAANAQDLADQLLSGYRQTLRPRLVIGRFRPPERNIDDFLARLRKEAKADDFRFSLSGGPAAYQLQKFYKGPHTPIFVRPATSDLPRQLRLLPDREGPVTLLKAFGDLVFWRSTDGVHLAHPWLIYAELMTEPDPRAHEAAEELRKEFLRQ
jgi:hypothetical protein